MNITKPKLFFAMMAAALTVVSIAPALAAGTPEIWGELEPGTYGVGFRTVEQYDYSRTFRPRQDYFGEPLDVEPARPIQVCIWYPAVSEENDMPMVYGEYSFPYPTDDAFYNLVAALQGTDINTVGFFVGGDAGRIQAVMDLSMAAVRDAGQADGSFPLIIYHPGHTGTYSMNVVLCEYLASHGFIVATTHSLGAYSAAYSGTPADFESVIRDREVAFQIMREQPGVDLNRVGLLGLGSGGSSALLQAMRNDQVSTLVTIEGDFLTQPGAERMKSNPYYAPIRMTQPWLMMHIQTPERSADLNRVDSLMYAPRTLLAVDGVRPQDLSSYALFGARINPDSVYTFERLSESHGKICESVRQFLGRHLQPSDSGSYPALDGYEGTNCSVAVSTREAQPIPPSPQEFIYILNTYDIVRAEELCEQFNLLDPSSPILSSNQFTGLGYQTMNARGDLDAALRIFEWGVTAYPGSANAWDSYGEACGRAGRLEEAIAHYEKALELVPSDSTLPPGLGDILTTNIPGILDGLRERLAEQQGQDGSDQSSAGSDTGD